MKKLRLVLLTMVMLSFATISMAQTLITSTQASTKVILPKSGRVKGFVIRPEIGLGTDFDFELLWINWGGTIAYQFNPRISIGGGICWDFEDYTFRSSFVNLRAYLTDTYCSPYIDIKAGPTKNTYKDYWDFMASAMLGIQCKGFDYGISIKYLDTFYEYWICSLNFAYNFQLGKKNK